MKLETRGRFTEGDLVYHKSNPGIKMVINRIYTKDYDEKGGGTNDFECTWITSKGKMRNESFCEFELEKSVTL
jgi:hypothetical protein